MRSGAKKSGGSLAGGKRGSKRGSYNAPPHPGRQCCAARVLVRQPDARYPVAINSLLTYGRCHREGTISLRSIRYLCVPSRCLYPVSWSKVPFSR
jgi:hypothetical protein